MHPNRWRPVLLRRGCRARNAFDNACLFPLRDVIFCHLHYLINVLIYVNRVYWYFSAIHRNSAASGLFIQAIHSRCDNLSVVSISSSFTMSTFHNSVNLYLRGQYYETEVASVHHLCYMWVYVSVCVCVCAPICVFLQYQPSFVKKTLQCLEAIHLSQSGALLSLLIDKFLFTHHLAVSRMCDAIACRRVEMLLAENMEAFDHTFLF